MEKTPYTILIQRGDYKLGRKTVGRNGEILTQSEEKWIPSADGKNLAIVPINAETFEPYGDAELFASWDTVHAAQKSISLLGLAVNMPNLSGIWKAAQDDGIDLCSYCPEKGDSCGICSIFELLSERK